MGENCGHNKEWPKFVLVAQILVDADNFQRTYRCSQKQLRQWPKFLRWPKSKRFAVTRGCMMQGCDLKLQSLQKGQQPAAWARGEGKTTFTSGTVDYGTQASNSIGVAPPQLQPNPSPGGEKIDSVCVKDSSTPLFHHVLLHICSYNHCSMC